MPALRFVFLVIQEKVCCWYLFTVTENFRKCSEYTRSSFFVANSNRSFLILNWLKLTYLVALTILNALQKDQIVFLR